MTVLEKERKVFSVIRMCSLGSCDDNIFNEACTETISNGLCPHFRTIEDRDAIVKNIKPWIDSSQKLGTFKKVVFNLKRNWVIDGKSVYKVKGG